MLLQCGHHGRGEPLCKLRNVITSDLAGHRGKHYVACRSCLGTAVVYKDGCFRSGFRLSVWLPLPRGPKPIRTISGFFGIN